MGTTRRRSLRSSLGSLIGVSVPMQRLYQQIQRASSQRHPLLLTGEAGTGKEAVARVIHSLQQPGDLPFVSVDCSSLGPALLESELLGYAKGAFVGASQAKRGLLQAAEDGTLFLDQITDLPIRLQAKLFRILQDGEFSPVGSALRIPFRARVIAATREDLPQLVKAGLFREDLYFFLNTSMIRLPPLRERRGDIPLLVDYFLHSMGDEEPDAGAISDGAMRQLMNYAWPGNVRELREVLRQAMARATDRKVGMDDLPMRVRASGGQAARPVDRPGRREDYSALLKALRDAGGDKGTAARILGIGKSTLYRKLKNYDL